MTEYVIHTGETTFVPTNFWETANALRIGEQKVRVLPTFGRSNRPTQSWLGVPMVVKGRVIGIISIQSLEQEHAFSQEQADLLTIVANQAAVAIENARLNKQLLTEERKRLEAEKFAYLGKLAGSLAHRIGNKGGLIRLCAKDLESKLDSLGMKDPWFEEQIDTIERSNRYVLNLADYIFKPVKARTEKRIASSIKHYLETAVYYADIPDDVLVEFRCAENLPLVPGNKYLVEAFLELITNALDAMQVSQMKIMTIEAKFIEECVEVSFTDSGKGISSGDADTIFGLFDQSADNKLSSEEYRGFGLWWVKTFITELGGAIWYESTLGKGTTFHVSLPAMEEGDEEVTQS